MLTESPIILTNRIPAGSLSTARFANLKQSDRLTSRIELIKLFSEIQFKAYCDRLGVQPNGKESQAIFLKQNQNSEVAKQFQLSIGANVLEQLSGLGQDTLITLQAFGKTLLSKPITSMALANQDSFKSSLLTGLANSNGERHYLSPQLTLTLANIFHSAWKTSKSEINPQNYQSATQSTLNQEQRLIIDSSKVRPDVINYDCLTVLFLCKHLAQLPEHKFQDLLDLSVPGNPKNLLLNFNTTSKNSSFYQEVTLPVELRRSEEKVSENRFPHHKLIQRVEADQEKFRAQLCFEEERIILPRVLNEVAGISSIEDPKFVELCLKVEDLKLTRERYIKSLTYVIENSITKYQDQIDSKNIFSVIRSLVPDSVEKNLLKFELDYKKKLNALSYITDKHEHEIHSISTYFEYRKEAIGINDLVRQAMVDNHPTERGGIFHNHYGDSYWKELFNNKGKVLLLKNAEKTYGMLVYYHPGKIPSSRSNLPELFKQPNRAYAEVMINSPERPKGTFAKLFGGMIASLQLTSAEYADGDILMINNRSISAANYFGFFNRNLRAINVTLPNKEKTSAIPISIPVSFRQHDSDFRDLQKSLRSNSSN